MTYRPTASQFDEFTDRKVIVTGGSRGIGAAVAQRFLDAGASVVTISRRKTDQTPEGSIFISGDLSTTHGVDQVAQEALEVLGGVDVLINNAGAARTFADGVIPDEEWVEALNINFLAAVRLTTALLPALRVSTHGSIVNVSSNAAKLAPVPLLHYAAAKGALEVYSRGLAVALAPAVRVNVVGPGSIDTPGGAEIITQMVDAYGISAESLTAGIPMGRVGDPRDVAELIAFLASDRAQWITGKLFPIDGGEPA